MMSNDDLPGAAPAIDGPETNPPGGRRRWRRVVVMALAGLALGVALLPTLLSTAPARLLALRQVNARIPGRLEVSSWSLGWFSGFRIDGVVLRDPEGQAVVEVASARMATSVPRLLGRTRRLGAVVVTAPRLDLVLHPDGGSNLLAALRMPSLAGAAKEKPGTDGRADGPPAAAVPLALAGEISIRDGFVSVRVPEVAEALTVHDLDLDLDLDLPERPVRLKVKGLVGKARSPLAVSATLTPPLDPGTVAVETALELSGLDLAEFAPLARHVGVPVTISGTVQGKVAVEATGREQVHVAVEMAARDLAATGGPLGKDRPTLATASLSIDLTKAGRNVEIATFAAESPLASAKAEGALILPEIPGGMPTGNLATTLHVQLANLAQELPRTLRLRKGMVPSGGELAMSARLASDQGRSTIVAAARLDGLAAMHEGRRLELDQPMVATLKAAFAGGELEVESLTLESSFAQATGKGSLRDFSLTLASDLAAAREEVAKFIDLQEVQAAGTAKLGLRVQEPAAGVHLINAQLDLAGLDLAGLTPRPARLDKATMILRAEVLAGAGGKGSPREFRNVEVILDTDMADGSLRLGRLVPPAAAGALPEVADGQVKLAADLGALSDFAAGIGRLPEGLALAGAMRLTTSLAIQNGLISAGGLSLAIAEPRLQMGERRIADAAFAFRGDIEASPGTRMMAGRGLVAEIAGGQLEISRLDIPDWGALPHGVSTDFAGRFELARLREVLREAMPMAADVAIAGTLAFNGTAAMPEPGHQRLALKADIANLAVSRAGEPLHREEKVSMETVATIDPKAGDIDFPEVAIASQILSLRTKATLRDMRVRKALSAEGHLACDFDRLGPVVAALSGQPVILAGHHEGPFKVATLLSAKTLRERILGSAVETAPLRLDRAGYDRIVASEVDAPLAVGGGIVTSSLRCLLGGGTVSLPATIDANAPVPALVLPPATTVLTDVDLANEVVSWLLVRFLPVFNGITAASGKVGLLARECQVPVEGDIAGGIRFDGDLGFSGGRMEAVGFLREVLAMAGIERQGVTLPDQAVAVTVRDGQATHGPLRFMVGKNPVSVYGHINLATKALDYRIELPITLEMVGGRSELHELLKGEVIEVRVEGHAKEPKIARDAFRDNLTRIIRTAGQRLLRRGLQDLLKRD